MFPAVGSKRPAMIFSNVVLPHPEGPSREVSWPRGKSVKDHAEPLRRRSFLVTLRTETAVSMLIASELLKAFLV